MEGLQVKKWHFLLLAFLGAATLRCRDSAEPQGFFYNPARSSPQISGILDRSTLSSAQRVSSGAEFSSRDGQPQLKAQARASDDAVVEVTLQPDGSFTLPIQHSDSYTVSFVSGHDDGSQAFIAVVAFPNGKVWSNRIAVGHENVNLGVIRLEAIAENLIVGVPQHVPAAAANPGLSMTQEPPAVVPGNRIILPQAGALEFSLLETEASLISDLYLSLPENILLMDDRVPEHLALDRFYPAGTEIQLNLEVDGNPLGLGTYLHSSLSGYAQVTMLSPSGWRIAFEDLPYYLADWDFNDFTVAMQLIPCPDLDGDAQADAACGGPDCDDAEMTVYANAPEICDGIDNQCPGDAGFGVVDEGCLICTDSDGDGYYLEADCGTPVDCNDGDNSINPGAAEVLCDGVDQDCDGLTDDDENGDGDLFSLCSGDCNDGDPDVFPGAPELCDLIDNQCPGDVGAGSVDEGCGCQESGDDLRVTNQAGWSGIPSLVWSGSEYGIAWGDQRDGNQEIYFARISAAGVKLGNDARITGTAGSSSTVSLVWTGSEYGASWSEDSKIYFARVSSTGLKLGGDVQVSDSSSNGGLSSLVWTGTEYGVAWQDFRNGDADIYFAHLSATGAKIGTDVMVSASTTSYCFAPCLAWSGLEYGVAWFDGRNGVDDIYFTRISSAGAKIGNDTRITGGLGAAERPWLAWNGQEYGISWPDDRSGSQDIYFTRISAAGAKIGGEIRVSSASGSNREAPLVWTGASYGITWYDIRDGNEEIYFANLSPSGVKNGSEVRVTLDPKTSFDPTLAWDGVNFGIGFFDNRSTDWEVFFARVKCSDVP